MAKLPKIDILLYVIFKSLVSNCLTVHFQNWVISLFLLISYHQKLLDDLYLVHVNHLDRAWNVKIGVEGQILVIVIFFEFG